MESYAIVALLDHRLGPSRGAGDGIGVANPQGKEIESRGDKGVVNQGWYNFGQLLFYGALRALGPNPTIDPRT